MNPNIIDSKKFIPQCFRSLERNALQHELIFNQKIGKNILKKSELLQKALEKRLERQKKHKFEKEKLNRRNSLEIRLEQQALKLNESNHQASESQPELEFIQIRSKLFPSSKSSGKKEFC